MRQQRARTLSDDELIAELRQVPSRTGRSSVTVADLRQHSTLSERVYIARFGSWPAAVTAAGLTIAPRGRYWSNEELAANLRRIIQLHDRTPTPAEMDRPPSTITSGTYRRRFGDLARAREALKT